MSLTIKIPKELETEEKNLLVLFASFLYEKGKLSLGQEAKMAGLPKRKFMQNLGKLGVSVFNFPVEDLEKELGNV